MNLSEFLHLNSLMLLTWYLISTLHIPPSLVHSLCFDYAIALISCLCTLSNRDSFINFLVCSVCLFSLNSSFCVLFEVFFQTFKLLFSFLNFLTHTFRSQKNKIKIKKKLRKQNHYTSRRQIIRFSPLLSSNFLWGHFQISLLCLHFLQPHSPSCHSVDPSLNFISVPLQPQFSPTRLCSSPSSLSSPGGTSQLLDTLLQVLRVHFQ